MPGRSTRLHSAPGRQNRRASVIRHPHDERRSDVCPAVESLYLSSLVGAFTYNTFRIAFSDTQPHRTYLRNVSRSRFACRCLSPIVHNYTIRLLNRLMRPPLPARELSHLRKPRATTINNSEAGTNVLDSVACSVENFAFNAQSSKTREELRMESLPSRLFFKSSECRLSLLLKTCIFEMVQLEIVTFLGHFESSTYT